MDVPANQRLPLMENISHRRYWINLHRPRRMGNGIHLEMLPIFPYRQVSRSRTAKEVRNSPGRMPAFLMRCLPFQSPGQPLSRLLTFSACGNVIDLPRLGPVRGLRLTNSPIRMGTTGFSWKQTSLFRIPVKMNSGTLRTRHIPVGTV